MLIGAMKSGTTTLHAHLSRHSRLYLCEPKEPGFFSRDERYARGIDTYRELFAAAAPEQLCGEASTCYTRWPHYADVAPRIAEHVPDVRFLFIMRDPVERAYSHYRHLCEEWAAAGKEIPGFAEAMEAAPEIVDASLYRVQLERFFSHFPAERFHLLSLEELRAHPAEVLGGVQDFLGVPREDLVGEAETRRNEAGTAIARKTMRKRLTRWRSLPGLSLAIDLVPPSLRARARATLQGPVSRWLARDAVDDLGKRVGPLDPESRARLHERFALADQQLEEVLGRPVPWGDPETDPS
jgi:hypothetical protein